MFDLPFIIDAAPETPRARWPNSTRADGRAKPENHKQRDKDRHDAREGRTTGGAGEKRPSQSLRIYKQFSLKLKPFDVVFVFYSSGGRAKNMPASLSSPQLPRLFRVSVSLGCA